MKKKSYFLIVFITFIFLFSCNDDSTLLNVDSLPNYNKNNYLVDTLKSIKVYSVLNEYNDSAYQPYNGLFYCGLLGYYNNTVFGNTTSAFFTQFAYTDTFKIDNTLELDSAGINLKINNVIGDTTSNFTINIYQAILIQKASSSFPINVNANTLYNNILIASKNVTISKSISKISINIPVNNIPYLNNVSKDSTSRLDSIAGFYITIEKNNSEGVLTTINYYHTESNLLLRYKKTNIEGKYITNYAKFYQLFKDNYSNIINVIPSANVINYQPSTQITNILNKTNVSTIYIATTGGAQVKVEFPDIYSTNYFNTSVLRAELIVPVTSVNNIPLPDSVYCYYKYNTKGDINFHTYVTKSVLKNNSFSLDITDGIQKIITKKSIVNNNFTFKYNLPEFILLPANSNCSFSAASIDPKKIILRIAYYKL